jgi:chlorobactene glucosyltransferase
MNPIAPALLAAAPWIVVPAVTMWRIARSAELGDIDPGDVSDAPLVSIIIPARDEARNIERCLRAALAADYPTLEVIVVDDRSTDGTGDIARAIARNDARVRVIDNEELPDGWFGKPWACMTGANAARGDILCFTDADARHGAHLVARAVRAMHDDRIDLLTVAGRQELGSFWERVIQPQIFWMLAMRFGGTDAVNRSKREEDKIANGQCIFMRRDAYDAIGGHAAVRDQVAEDLALAQRTFAVGQRTKLFLGRRELTTRMYTTLAEIMAGWRKNMFAGGRDAMPWGTLGRIILPALLVVGPLSTVLPLVVLVVSAVIAMPMWLTLAAGLAVAAQVATWVVVYRWMEAPVAYALLFPLGATVVAVIALQAIGRGTRVEWKGRRYVTSPVAPRTRR